MCTKKTSVIAKEGDYQPCWFYYTPDPFIFLSWSHTPQIPIIAFIQTHKCEHHQYCFCVKMSNKPVSYVKSQISIQFPMLISLAANIQIFIIHFLLIVGIQISTKSDKKNCSICNMWWIKLHLFAILTVVLFVFQINNTFSVLMGMIARCL